MQLLKNRLVQAFLLLNVLVFFGLMIRNSIWQRQYEERLYKHYASTRVYFTRNKSTDEESFRRFVRVSAQTGETHTMRDSDLAWSAQMIMDTLPFDDRESVSKRDRIQLQWNDIEAPTENQKKIMLGVSDAIVKKWNDTSHDPVRVGSTDKILALTTLICAGRDNQPAFVESMLKDDDADVRDFAHMVPGVKAKFGGGN